MANFQYKGRDNTGDLVEGIVDAVSAEAVAQQLQSKLIMPIEIVVHKESASHDIDLSRFLPEPAVTLQDLSMFCRQMKALSRSGIPIIQAITGLAENTRSVRLKRALLDINSRLQMGATLANALDNHKDIFSSLFISMVHVGENTGKLDEAFEKLVHHLELERETKKRVKQATRYPMMVMTAMMIAMGIVNLFVIPQFNQVFMRLGADLPTPTRVLMATSNFMVDYWWLLLGIMIASAVSFFRYINTDAGRYWWDKKKIRLPIIGGIFEKTALARFCRSFAMMFRSGVPVLQCLNVVGGTLDNSYISHAINDIRSGVERGETLARTCANSGMFTSLILQMISVGEESGNLDALLEDVAEFYEDEIEYDLKQLADAIEPIILVFLGVLVLMLALGVFLPMWELGSAMTR